VNRHLYQNNLWRTLDNAIFMLAPMEDVTDTVLRQAIARDGKTRCLFH
jgi:tRNA-dihydrouridine synthase